MTMTKVSAAPAQDLDQLVQERAAIEAKLAEAKLREAVKKRESWEAELRQLRDNMFKLEQADAAEFRKLQEEEKKIIAEISEMPQERLKRLRAMMLPHHLAGGGKLLVRARERVKKLTALLESQPPEEPAPLTCGGANPNLEALRGRIS